jgi:hypothetical protein
MSTMIIEWFYHEKSGASCSRCSDSYRAVRKAIEQVSGVLKERGVAVELKEHRLDENSLDRSNTVTINGRDIMDLLNERGDIFTFCRSCTDLTGKPTECRIFIYKNKAYESIPEEMLVNALLQEAGAEDRTGKAEEPSWK